MKGAQALINSSWTKVLNRYLPGRTRTPPVLAFLHIPKTAGTSLVSMVQQNVSSESAIYLYQSPPLSIEQVSATLAEKGEKLSAIVGHFHYSSGFLQIYDGSVLRATILREPIQRIVSHYFYLRSIADENPVGKRLVDDNASLVDFITRPYTPNSDNLMVRMLCSDDCNELPWGECRREMLEQAKHNLTHGFDVVGFTEDYDSFSHLVSQAMRWSKGVHSRTNVTQSKPPIDAIDSRELEIVRENSSLDIELYEFAWANLRNS